MKKKNFSTFVSKYLWRLYVLPTSTLSVDTHAQVLVSLCKGYCECGCLRLISWVFTNNIGYPWCYVRYIMSHTVTYCSSYDWFCEICLASWSVYTSLNFHSHISHSIICTLIQDMSFTACSVCLTSSPDKDRACNSPASGVLRGHGIVPDRYCRFAYPLW